MVEKNKRIELRVTEKEKTLLQELAKGHGLRLSQYILQMSLYQRKKGN